jgi:anti-sigma B factor antagonist
MVLNFQNVNALSSSALGMLITVNAKVGDKKGKLVLASLEGPIRDVFRITKLDKAFTLCDSLAEAMSAVR